MATSAKVGKRLESGAHDMPQVREGCTAKTKVKLLAKRGAFFGEWLVSGRFRVARVAGAGRWPGDL